MATKSNFKRAMPASQQQQQRALHSVQLVDDAKSAVLPAGTPFLLLPGRCAG